MAPRSGGIIAVVSLKESKGVDFILGFGWTGQTNLALPTSGTLPSDVTSDVLLSTDTSNRVYVQSDQPEIKIVEHIHHELRAHVFLSNMGRNIMKGRHEAPGVTSTGRAAEAEAGRNYRQSSGVPRKKK